MYANNTAKTKREIVRHKKQVAYEKMKAFLHIRNGEFRSYCQNNREGLPETIAYVEKFRKENLTSIKQVSFNPTEKVEEWEVKDHFLTWVIRIYREILSIGVEKIQVNNVLARYSGIEVYIGNNLYSELNTREGYGQTIRFFSILTDYSKEFVKGKEK